MARKVLARSRFPEKHKVMRPESLAVVVMAQVNFRLISH